jgi:hypothetical protein
VLTTEHKKYIAGACKPQGDVFEALVLLYVSQTLFITGYNGILAVRNPITPPVELALEAVQQYIGAYSISQQVVLLLRQRVLSSTSLY